MPRFAILEHTWDGVHWDLMLERDGALATWAVDAPIVAGADLPARRLPDHRIAYLDYEGAISGDRGSVRRVDRGTYEILTWADDVAVVRLDGAQIRGEVEVRKELRDGTWKVRLGNVD